MFDGPIDHLAKLISALPGLGSRSAKRVVLHLLTHKEKSMVPLIKALQEAASAISECHTCGNLDTAQPCRICRDNGRDSSILCIVASVADVWAVERTGSFRGRYHVLGGVLSALDGIGPQDLRIDSLISRLKEGNFAEVILALSATVDGQSTAHVITDHIMDLPQPPKISRLAHGMPVGGELDYLDDGTIATALKSRSAL